MGQICSCANCVWLKKTYVRTDAGMCHTCMIREDEQNRYIPIAQSWDRVCVHWKGME